MYCNLSVRTDVHSLWYELDKLSYNLADCFVIFWRLSHCIYFKHYPKNPIILDSRKFAVVTLKVERDGFSLE